MQKVNHHAPAAGTSVIPQKSGGAFGIPECMPPIRRQDFQSNPQVPAGTAFSFHDYTGNLQKKQLDCS